MTKKIIIMMGKDGLPDDNVTHAPATAEQLGSYEQAAEKMYQCFKAPCIFQPADVHTHVLIGLIDDIPNGDRVGPLFATNIAKFRDQITELNRKGVERIHCEYVAGLNGQANIFDRMHDNFSGRSSLRSIEELHDRLVERARSIWDNDPEAKIMIHLEGVSHGASLVPLAARRIYERSLRSSGNDAQRIPVTVGLYDPMPARYMKNLDCRLPPCVVSGLQISAIERRSIFPSNWAMPNGLSTDGRFLNLLVAGANKDICGGYLRDGLAIRSLNIMTDYHNHLFGELMILRTHEPLDPRMNVIHKR